MAADSRTVRNGAVPGHSGAHGSQERPARGKQAPVKKTKEPHNGGSSTGAAALISPCW